MNYPLISEYVEAIKSPEDNFNQLKNLRPVLDEAGNPIMSSGNFAVVFKMEDPATGKRYAVKCFIKDQEGRSEAYRLISEELKDVESDYLTSFQYLEKELFVDTVQSRETEFPVLVMNWVEGVTLDRFIQENQDDQYILKVLTYRFSLLAEWLLSQSFAHGDLKPDNIIVLSGCQLTLVDYDGMYVPSMKGQKAREIGSIDFRHPKRNIDSFNKCIDDFSVISILFSLKAISIDSSLLWKFGAKDRLLLSANDYNDIYHSAVINYLHPNEDLELNKIVALLYLSIAQNDLREALPSLVSIKRVYDPDRSEKASFHDEDGVIYSYDGFVLISAPKTIEQYRCKNGIISIKNHAFHRCEKLKRIYIPESVFEIGYAAFGFCESLTDISIPGDVSVIEMGTFMGCKSLNAVRLPDSIKEIKWHAFEGCSSIKSMTIPWAVEKIEEGIFAGCTDLSHIQVSGANKYYDSREGCNAIINTKNNILIAGCSHTIIPDSVFEIGKHAFLGHVHLASIFIPNSITHIHFGSFSRCKELKTIIIPDSIVSIEEGSFQDCDGLTSIIVSPNNKYFDSRDNCNAIIQTKEDYLIVGCATTVVPDSVTCIFNRAFLGCTGLTSIFIPQKVNRIGDLAFFGCSGMKSISLSNSVQDIGISAFYACSELTTIIIPNSVKTIRMNAFERCTGLSSLEFPESVTCIERNAFQYCTKLSSILIHNPNLEIGHSAFQDCPNLKRIIIPSGSYQRFRKMFDSSVLDSIIIEQ